MVWTQSIHVAAVSVSVMVRNQSITLWLCQAWFGLNPVASCSGLPRGELYSFESCGIPKALLDPVPSWEELYRDPSLWALTFPFTSSFLHQIDIDHNCGVFLSKVGSLLDQLVWRWLNIKLTLPDDPAEMIPWDCTVISTLSLTGIVWPYCLSGLCCCPYTVAIHNSQWTRIW